MYSMTLSHDALNNEYRGCGKAWAALQNGEVVALRYMGDFALKETALPAWVRAVQKKADGLDERFLPTASGGTVLRRIWDAAIVCADCPKPPRRDQYRPKELLAMARAILAATERAQFGEYRHKCRSELAAIGDVVSGICSCTEFVVR